MMKKLIYLILSCFLLISCTEEPLSPNHIERTVIVYAVNKSSLAYDFSIDMKEMLESANYIDLSKYQILLYKTDTDTKCGLYNVITDKNGTPQLRLIKSYDRDKTSTSPDRINEVLEYSLSLFPDSEYDLIFWGHGMSWRPYYSDHTIKTPQSYSYGGEYDGGYNDKGNLSTDWTAIDELASAIPDHELDIIWFDCCYMSGIEVIYEFRNKCNTFVGYPSEVWGDGLPYNLVLPYILNERHDIMGAAREFFDYYNYSNSPVTVAMLDMSQIENVADATKAIIASGAARPESSALLNYSRTYSSPFYDFRQFISEIAELNIASDDAKSDFLNAFNKLIVYSAGSDMDFNFRPWNTSNLSGISTHFYQGGILKDEDFYESLSWFKRVYQ